MLSNLCTRQVVCAIVTLSFLTFGIQYTYFHHLTPAEQTTEAESKGYTEVYLPQEIATTTKTSMERQEQQLSHQTKLEDIFISIKTTASFYEKRFKAIVETWLQDAINQIYVITDAEQPVLQKKLPAHHVVVTNCSTKHDVHGLNCKMMHEFYMYYKVDKRWFCHFDDDNYLNVPNLMTLLQKYNHDGDWYLGKLSVDHPFVAEGRDIPGFWFAHGGAGFCISRSLAHKMMRFVTNDIFITLAKKVNAWDDVMVGYIINSLLHINLTEVRQLHSHREHLESLPQHDLKEAITLSYHQDNPSKWNRIKIEGFSLGEDPTRFLSIRCFLMPQLPMCINIKL